MKTTMIAALTGAFATATIAALPLWLQHQRLISLKSSPSAWQHSSSLPIIRERKDVPNQDSIEEAELLAAESVQNLNARECRLAADAAVASGNVSTLSDLLGRWASVDGKEAFAWLAGRPVLFSQTILEAGPAWAASDPAGYAAWLVEYLPLGQCGSDFDNYIYCKWLAPFDLRAAIRIAMQKSWEARKSGLFSGQLLIGKLELSPFITSGKVAKDLADEIMKHPEWLTPIRQGKSEWRPLVPEENPIELLRALRQCWQDVDAAGWDDWAAKHPELAARADNKPRDPGEVLLLSKNQQSDATRILSEAPPDKQGQVLKSVMAAWTYLDLNAAGTWLRNLSEGPVKWEGVQEFALTAVQEDPVAALLWADSISDPSQQARAQRRVFTSWSDSDPSAAIAWLAQSAWNESQIKAARDIMAAGKTGGK